MHDNDEISDAQKQLARILWFLRQAVNNTNAVTLDSNEIGRLAVQFKLALDAENATLVFEPDLSDVTK